MLHSKHNFPNLIHFKNRNYKVGRKTRAVHKKGVWLLRNTKTQFFLLYGRHFALGEGTK
jgi:hypothetical protein